MDLLGEKPTDANIYLHGSFALTGVGHGTDKAIVAGLLGMDTDDTNIPNSFEIAKKENLNYKISTIELKDAHPNTALLELTGENGRELKIVASSLGGGRISVEKIDRRISYSNCSQLRPTGSCSRSGFNAFSQVHKYCHT